MLLKFHSYSVLLVLVLGFFCLSPGAFAQNAETYKTLIQQGRDFLAKGDFDNAFTKGTAAMALDPNQYEASFLCGDIEAKQGLRDLAKEFYTQALKTAPESAKAAINAAMAGLEKGGTSDELTRQADDLLAQGLKAKAAKVLLAALRAAPTRTDLGLKAAKIFDELGDHVNAARAAGIVITSGPGTPAAKEAEPMAGLFAVD